MNELKSDNVEIQRYKGLGEMNFEQLWETTMNPKTRSLIQVTSENAKNANNIIQILMGQDSFGEKRMNRKKYWIYIRKINFQIQRKIMNNNDEKTLKVELDELISEKFGNYSKYIIQERALPDVRDGLKPVQRRILFAMHDLKLTDKSTYKKSARVVGDVIGKYHPHGDSSVYDAMIRMGQEWKLNIPLVDVHGNKGSVDGDSPAAMRYTEARLSPLSVYLLKNIEKKIVSFLPQFWWFRNGAYCFTG